MEKNPFATKTIWFDVQYAVGKTREYWCTIPDGWDENKFAEAVTSLFDRVDPTVSVSLQR